MLPEPGGQGRCPECARPVLAKCGPIICWHWAHLPGEGHECSTHGESEWHRRWKWWALNNGCQVEVPFHRSDGSGARFRADILTTDGHVVELQSKPPAFDTILRREQAYGWRLRWLFRITEKQQLRIKWGRMLNNGGQGFRFKRGPKLMTVCKRPVYFDLEMDGQLVRVSLSLRPSFYDESRTVMLGVAYDSRDRELFDIRDGDQLGFLPILSGQEGTSYEIGVSA